MNRKQTEEVGGGAPVGEEIREEGSGETVEGPGAGWEKVCHFSN